MKIKANEIYYYADNLDSKFASIVKLKALRDAEGELALPFIILEFIVGKPQFAGHEDALKIGALISANQLNGVGVIGASNFIFKEKQIIEKIFSS